ncbi:hypothetical protein EVAR_66180_1 [Eumeta japonica]|uniref:Uncharacterized protein n=1 Tax=Eumeta variegata TaxID=151549 RepID=A0A4C1ZTE3_EUMVA|nr:hypothetical protein EVAR_66180_1 [Eumeta japonica]
MGELTCGLLTSEIRPPSIRVGGHVQQELPYVPDGDDVTGDDHHRSARPVVCGRCLSSTRTHRRWSGREIARSALSIARSTQAEHDNESCFFMRAAGVHRFIRRYHVKNGKSKNARR